MKASKILAAAVAAAVVVAAAAAVAQPGAVQELEYRGCSAHTAAPQDL
jgi:hypothetical protein